MRQIGVNNVFFCDQKQKVSGKYLIILAKIAMNH